MTEKKRILLVDDDQSILDSMKMALEARGYQISAASDGAIGMERVDADLPHLMILDQMMPEQSGFCVLEYLRQSQSPVPVIMITANEGFRHRAYAENLGVNEYLQKPFSMDQLVAAVETTLA